MPTKSKRSKAEAIVAINELTAKDDIYDNLQEVKDLAAAEMVSLTDYLETKTTLKDLKVMFPAVFNEGRAFFDNQKGTYEFSKKKKKKKKTGSNKKAKKTVPKKAAASKKQRAVNQTASLRRRRRMATADDAHTRAA